MVWNKNNGPIGKTMKSTLRPKHTCTEGWYINEQNITYADKLM